MKKQSIFILLVTAGLSACSFPGNAQNRFLFAQNPVVAHRGAWEQSNLPQNSIASLKNAIALKCTGSEFDVRSTAEDILIKKFAFCIRLNS